MKTDEEIKVEGTQALIHAMGPVEAERYVALMSRGKFDYTTWRQTVQPEGSVREISHKAARNGKEE